LISIIEIEWEIVLFYETHAQISSCKRGEMNLDYSKIIITNKFHGVFYNYTSDTLHLFSREAPKIYYKLINSRTDNELS